jgi:hypothetical protein
MDQLPAVAERAAFGRRIRQTIPILFVAAGPLVTAMRGDY